MRIGRMIAPIHALGPGERVGLWIQGCSRKCPGCISPELRSQLSGSVMSVEKLAELVIETAKHSKCTGLTISGGEPMEQAASLLKFLTLVRNNFQDILVYTGYTLNEIQLGRCGDGAIAALSMIDVLIDGPYMEKLNNKDCVLRGSENQVIHYLNRDITEKYREYLSAGRVTEYFSHDGEIVFVGILNREE